MEGKVVPYPTKLHKLKGLENFMKKIKTLLGLEMSIVSVFSSLPFFIRSKKFSQTTNKKLLTKMLLIQLVIAALVILEARAGKMADQMAMRDGETSTQHSNRVKQAEETETHRQNMTNINTSLLHNAQETNNSARSFLSRHRLIWYTTFASVGSALAISNAFDINDPGGYTPFILGGIATGLVVGGGAGYMINKYYPGATECMHNTCVNVSTGLLSFVPWIIFGVTKNKNNP